MKFHKNVSQELREILSEEYNRYIRKISMSPEERDELRKWVQSGHSPSDNSWGMTDEAGNPMDFVAALRFVASSVFADVIYDTASDDIVFVAGADSSEDFLQEELPF